MNWKLVSWKYIQYLRNIKKSLRDKKGEKYLTAEWGYYLSLCCTLYDSISICSGVLNYEI